MAPSTAAWADFVDLVDTVGSVDGVDAAEGVKGRAMDLALGLDSRGRGATGVSKEAKRIAGGDCTSGKR
jgi:hypothetical protein